MELPLSFIIGISVLVLIVLAAVIALKKFLNKLNEEGLGDGLLTTFKNAFHITINTN